MRESKNPDAERMNPCLKEQEESYKCLNNNNYNHDKCAMYFDNYNICKKFWGKVYNERRTQGLYPYLPEVKDRARIKDEYLKKMKE